MAIPAFFKIAAEAKKYKGAAEGDISSVAAVAGVGKFDPDKRIEPGKELANDVKVEFDPNKRIDVDKLDNDPLDVSPNSPIQEFDPDKRIDVDSETETSAENKHDAEKKTNDSSETKDLPKKEISDGEFYTKLEDRVEHASHGDGTWSGEPGQSEFTPNDPKAKEALEQKGLNSIKYDNNGEPNFHPVSEATVKIENMTANRYPSFIDENGVRHVCNFEKADIKLADQWNAECKDGKTDWNKSDVNKWVKDNNLTRHECLDKETMEYVDSDIHKECKHYGGVAECKARDISNSGGKFDV